MAETYDITSDGACVWVNAADGSCVGRYGRLGVDVHKDVAAMLLGEGQCLDCRRHTGVLDDDWAYFKASMLHHYGVVVGEEHKPHENRSWLT